MKKILVNIIFGIHVCVFLFFPLAFFIPASVWEKRIEFHFWYCFSLFMLFYLWGMLWTLRRKDKIYSICILDTLMQYLRGYSMWDPKNYEHSFVEEMTTRFGRLRLANERIPLLLLICIILSAGLYLLKLEGVILY
ncbi:MAG: hypothetical protein COV59_02250 [Candidatus Magasanikbacteria bacterium CG11_big_fil_rev_8_21_14_0_20_39_34]|uniref:DUF2784 domain-containing protein n=1 Tax=Candidatus Magasanikbacteria bacterium CG11_big_fil_rev_8_21_14_0_20_39_34 TaxID=1974653 RepID=A0A2H0N513_9BACT|nr:MAG: hypothetical protein COV59_02250 [Candidatus Magasanikbacteria bacterium CG11_big_fil_rev_8_21_14_0_20_39_34]